MKNKNISIVKLCDYLFMCVIVIEIIISPVLCVYGLYIDNMNIILYGLGAFVTAIILLVLPIFIIICSCISKDGWCEIVVGYVILFSFNISVGVILFGDAVSMEYHIVVSNVVAFFAVIVLATQGVFDL